MLSEREVSIGWVRLMRPIECVPSAATKAQSQPECDGLGQRGQDDAQLTERGSETVRRYVQRYQRAGAGRRAGESVQFRGVSRSFEATAEVTGDGR